MLQFGHELRRPVDLLLGRPEEAATPTDYCEKLQERSEHMHSYARENFNITTARAKNYFGLHADDITYKEGDAVWLRNFRKKVRHSPKRMWPWEGPYTIIKVIDNVVYRVKLTPRSKGSAQESQGSHQNNL